MDYKVNFFFFIFLFLKVPVILGTPGWLFGTKGVETAKVLQLRRPKITEYPLITDISINPDDVRFFLFPNSNDKKDYDEIVYENMETITRSRYNPNLPVVILTHGFTQNFLSDFPTVVKEAYLEMGYDKIHNIIAVDWGKLSGPRLVSSGKLTFLNVFRNSIPVVTSRIAEFIEFLIKAGVLKGGYNVHMIGQSLGAHTSAFAARKFKTKTGTKIRRLTATDPAGPLFNLFYHDRMSSLDASFVDVIHTDAGNLGYDGHLGTADFNVNGGRRVQPDCVDQGEWCSHNMAPHYYAMSIRNASLFACVEAEAKKYGAAECPEPFRVPFGVACPTWAHGAYDINLKEGIIESFSSPENIVF